MLAFQTPSLSSSLKLSPKLPFLVSFWVGSFVLFWIQNRFSFLLTVSEKHLLPPSKHHQLNTNLSFFSFSESWEILILKYLCVSVLSNVVLVWSKHWICTCVLLKLVPANIHFSTQLLHCVTDPFVNNKCWVKLADIYISSKSNYRWSRIVSSFALIVQVFDV